MIHKKYTLLILCIFEVRMGKFKAKMELPRFVSKEEILGKDVYDSNLVYVGTAKDCDYTSDGTIEMILKSNSERIPTLILLNQIDRVGDHILLKVSITQFKKDLGSIARAKKLSEISEKLATPQG